MEKFVKQYTFILARIWESITEENPAKFVEFKEILKVFLKENFYCFSTKKKQYTLVGCNKTVGRTYCKVTNAIGHERGNKVYVNVYLTFYSEFSYRVRIGFLKEASLAMDDNYIISIRPESNIGALNIKVRTHFIINLEQE